MPVAATSTPIDYASKKGVDAFVDRVAEATPMQTFEAELRGVDSLLLKDLAKRMDIPAVRLFQIVGIPKATAERKTAAQEPITGAAGQAALGLTHLLGLAKGIVADSTAMRPVGWGAGSSERNLPWVGANPRILSPRRPAVRWSSGCWARSKAARISNAER